MLPGLTANGDERLAKIKASSSVRDVFQAAHSAALPEKDPENPAAVLLAAKQIASNAGRTELVALVPLLPPFR
jgi:hypothetical protein